jgi:arylformamidase
MRLIDVTVGLWPEMPTYANRPGPSRDVAHAIAQGHRSNSSVFHLGSHDGTHVDAPLHFIADGAPVDQLPLDALVGPARVVEVANAGHITAAMLDALAWPPGTERVLFKTRNSARWDEPTFYEDFVAVAPDAARWLVERGVRLVGIDYLSIEAYDPAGTAATHTMLLGAGVVIVEGLDLRGVAPGAYTVMCLPLKFLGADGAPARVLLAAE